MPVIPEEPEIHESIPGPGVPFPRESDAHAHRTPAVGSATPSPATVPGSGTSGGGVPGSVVPGSVVPGPRPASPSPAPPRAGARPTPPPARTPIPKPGPGPRRPTPEVRLVPAAVREAVERADEAVDLLLESGRRPGDILVLTVGEPHPWQQHELSFGEERYWAQLAEGDDVFYAEATATRPLRRDVVVLVVNEARTARVQQAARKALGHAGALLLVCGEPGLVEPIFPGANRPVPA
nr:hypothetical protein [Kitasatospora sp. GP82]